jgi:hypothetical protein
LNSSGSNAEQTGGFQNTGSLRQFGLYTLLDLCGNLRPAKLNMIRLGRFNAAITRSRIIARSNSANTPII